MNPYWRDVGTLDSYFEASMEVLNPKSQLQLDKLRTTLRELKVAENKLLWEKQRQRRRGEAEIHRQPARWLQSVGTVRWRFTRWSDDQSELYDHDSEELPVVDAENPEVSAWRLGFRNQHEVLGDDLTEFPSLLPTQVII